ncbi:hypothetical protein HGRIS_006964 [Hohenbuehelia grisea]|uniref:Noc2-domain-containing protein n=1 Tax=Hohenbuehelia grisea TaxID=104357 RepID=A0ABR3JBC2_9AGAR
MGKATKATKKFVSSGQLKKTIEARHKKQQIKKRMASRRGANNGKPKAATVSEGAPDDEEDGEEDEAPSKAVKSKGKAMTVDDILGGGFMDESDEDEGGMSSDGEGEGADEDDISEAGSFASVDDLDDEGAGHLEELSKLAERDPEFYKYLQENDRELLDFDPSTTIDLDEPVDDEDEDEDVEMEDRLPNLTMAHLNQWQKALLQQRSLRALRKLLIAFRSAAHMNEEGQVLAWSIDNSTVYNKLVVTALKYTPVVLEHHLPYKTLPDGRFKAPTQNKKFQTLQKLILSYFQNILHLTSQLTDSEMLQLAVKESAKLIPYVISSRRTVKGYLKKCLELWSSAEDSIRIAAFLSIRRLVSSTDQSILDNVLKSTYLTFVRSSKSTNAHTLPSINLMKNSASEIFCLDHAVSYQHAFGYIRQLAIHLRNSMKVKTKEAYKQVYNWQYVHCIDFWSIVIARACDVSSRKGGAESELSALIYPLVQVSLGAIKLMSSSRCYPFHFHIIRSLLHLTQHTETYVPIAPYLVPILVSTITSSSRPKASTLRPLDFELQIRAPQQYLKTRVYSEGVVEEAAHLLAEWLGSPVVQGSIAFPEITVPIAVSLRKALKATKGSKGSSGKDIGVVKALLERIEDSTKWVEQKRANVSFAPGQMEEVDEWEGAIRSKVGDSPLCKYVKVQRKAREKRRKLVEKARKGEGQMLEDDD